MTPSLRYHERAEFDGHVATLPASSTSAATARRFVRRLLPTHTDAALRANVELLTSELVTNAVVHAGTEFELRLCYPRHDAVRIEVTDQADGTPAVQPGAPTDPSGRGLQLVDAVADAWGAADASPVGKIVWFETSL